MEKGKSQFESMNMYMMELRTEEKKVKSNENEGRGFTNYGDETKVRGH